MEKRKLGRTNHYSTLAIFGGAAFWDISQEQADQAMEKILAAGVNHIDIAPSYGTAELRLGPWMPKIRDKVFLGCKTMERNNKSAEQELHESLKRLKVATFDLYQIHAITTLEELDEVTRPGGALEALQAARRRGLTRFIGITGHGAQTPEIFLEALERFDFDTVLFPVNFIEFADEQYARKALELIQVCKTRDVGMMGIKSVSRGPWKEHPKNHTTWYRPFTSKEMIQQAVNYALSQGITGICTVGDLQLLPEVISACEKFEQMDEASQRALEEQANNFEPLFVNDLRGIDH